MTIINSINMKQKKSKYGKHNELWKWIKPLLTIIWRFSSSKMPQFTRI